MRLEAADVLAQVEALLRASGQEISPELRAMLDDLRLQAGPADSARMAAARPPHSPTPVRVLSVSGAAGAKAISCSPAGSRRSSARDFRLDGGESPMHIGAP